MKTLLILTLLVLSGLSYASRESRFKSLNTCYHGVLFTEDRMLANFDAQTIQVDPLNDQDRSFGDLNLNEEYVDMAIDGDDLYVLTVNAIQHWNFKTLTKIRTIASHTTPPPYEWNMSPRGIDVYKNKIFVAHDGRGVSVIDKMTGKNIGNIYPQGFSQDISVKNGKGYIITDAAEMMGGTILPGIFAFDPETFQITKKTLLNSSPSGAIDIQGDYLYIGSQYYWKLFRKTVDTKKIVGTYSRVITPYAFGRGKPFYDEQNVYLCGTNNTPYVMPLPKN